MKRWHIVLIVMFVVIGLAGYGVLRHYVPYSLENELAEARRQGIPTAASEVRLPVIPPGQDAGPIYERAWALEKQNDFTQSEKALLDQLVKSGVSDAEAARLRRAFNARQEYLAALHEAASRPHLSLPPTPFDPTSPPFGQLAHSREAARTFREEASFLLREGRPLEAVRIQSLGYGIGAQLLKQPMVLSLFTGTATAAITDAGLRDILKKSPPNAAVADAVMEAAGRNLDEPDLHNVMSTELARYGESLRMLGPAGANGGSLLDRMKEKSKCAVDAHWETKLIRASEGTPFARRAALKAVADRYARAKNRGYLYEYSDMSVPVGPKLEDICARSAAGRRVVYAAAAVLKYRAQLGRFPATLDEAVKPVPQDPIGNCPLTYRRTTRGFEVRAAQTHARISANGLEFTYP